MTFSLRLLNPSELQRVSLTQQNSNNSFLGPEKHQLFQGVLLKKMKASDFVISPLKSAHYGAQNAHWAHNDSFSVRLIEIRRAL